MAQMLNFLRRNLIECHYENTEAYKQSSFKIRIFKLFFHNSERKEEFTYKI